VQMMMRLKTWLKKKTAPNRKDNNDNSSIPRAHGVTT
jgi:hypothetical protein